MADQTEQPIVIKKIVKGGGGHHGGAWKVAYADFVTAMMAFFLLLWLLNVTTSEQKDAISNFFDPSHPMVANKESGAGGVLGGLSISPEGAMVTNVQKLTNPEATGRQATTPPARPKPPTRVTDNVAGQAEKKKELIQRVKEEMRKKEQNEFKFASDRIKAVIENDPELSGLAKHLQIDITEEGLRIQVIDKDGEPMFPPGSARMFSRTKKLLEQVAVIVGETDNDISVRGHTDATKYRPGATYTNWELSADRANASRRELINAGISSERLSNVMGRADTELYNAEDPSDPQNRRIAIVLLKKELTDPDEYTDEAVEDKIRNSSEYSEELEEIEGGSGFDESDDPLEDINIPAAAPVPDDAFRQTPGRIQFP